MITQKLSNGVGLLLSAIKLGSLDKDSLANSGATNDKTTTSDFGDQGFGLFYDPGTQGFYLLSGTTDNGTWTLQLHNLAVNTSSSQPTKHTVGPNYGVSTLVSSFTPIKVKLPPNTPNPGDYIHMYGQGAASQYGVAKIFIVANNDVDGKPVGQALYTNIYSPAGYTWPSLALSAKQNFPNDGYTIIRNNQLAYTRVVTGNSTFGYYYAPPAGSPPKATIIPIPMKSGFSEVNVSSGKVSVFGVSPSSQSDDTYLYVYNGVPEAPWGSPISGDFSYLQPLANSGNATMLLWGGESNILLSDSTPKLLGKATTLAITPSVISSSSGSPLDVLDGGLILFGGTIATPSPSEPTR